MTISRVGKRLWYAAATIIILVALLISMGRLLTPYFNDHIPDIEKWISRYTRIPLSIGNAWLSWNIYRPELTFDQVKILDPVTHKPKFTVDHASINLNIFRSVMEGSFVIGTIRFSGAHLTIRENEAKTWNIEGLTDLTTNETSAEPPLEINQILGPIFSIPSLVLEDITLEIHPDKKPILRFLTNRLILNNSNQKHTLNGYGVLIQDVPTKVDARLKWQGDMADLSQVRAEIYLYLEGVNLSQWLAEYSWNQFQIKQGLGSARIWAEWNHNTFQSIQTRVQFYAFNVMSQLSKKTLIIPRISGHFGWRRDGEKQIFAGNQIFLDLQNHLWPETSFTVTTLVDANGKLQPTYIEASYFDLLDVKKMMDFTGIFSEEMNTRFENLNPQGEIRQFKLQYNPLLGSQDIKAYTLSTGFNNLNVNPWEKWPGVSHLSGLFFWNGQKATLQLNSQKTAINIKDYFSRALTLDELNGTIEWEHNENNTILTLKKLITKNSDVETQSNMNLSMSANNATEINLTSDFQVLNAAHLHAYMPDKILDPDLAIWLKNAFHGGRLESGQLILQGNLADFPFENGKGKFYVSGLVKNIDLHFAPDWPLMREIMGKITLTGSRMTIDIHSGNILTIPISVVGQITNFGLPDSQILTVQGNIQTDLSQALRVIHESPLKKILGENLGTMTLQGPMQLQLGIVVPLKTPNQVKVNGDATFSNARLGLKDTPITLTALQGGLHFTESEIESKNIQGKFAGANAVLDIRTTHSQDKMSFVRATLQSRLNISLLQSWLKLPLNSFAEGETDFQAELHLYSEREAALPAEMNIHSELKGITLHLPEQLGKKADETRDLQIDLLIKHQDLRLKMNYNTLITAALDYKRYQEGFRFISGEVNLGGEAQWQDQPGLVLSGEFKQLDWDLLQSRLTTQRSALDTNLVRSIRLYVDNFKILGQELTHTQIQLTKENKNWNVNINSNQVVGQLFIPENFQQMIEAKFQRLFLTSDKKEKEITVDIKKIPSLSFLANDVRYNDKSFGFVSFNIVPSPSAINIKNLHVQSSLVDLQGQGEWRMQNEKNISRLSGTLTTQRLSELLRAWGYDLNSLLAGKADAKFDLQWSGVIFNPSLATLSGNVSMNLGEGRIINLSESNNAKMDLARLLNIFSFSSFSRHVSGEAGSNTEKGYDFDYIKGDFTLNNGNAMTDNIKIDGPVAGMQISGNIGLATKTIDIKLALTPYVTSGISTVVAIASFQPVVGVAAMLVDKMIGHTVAKAISYHYLVRGSWENPQWNQQ